MNKPKKLTILLLLAIFVSLSAAVLVGCERKPKPSIDDIWQANFYTMEDGTEIVNISGLTEEGKKYSKLTLPEKIAGVKVKKMFKSAKPLTFLDSGPGDLRGKLWYLTIEGGGVEIDPLFFSESGVIVIELLSEEKPILGYDYGWNYGGIYIVPDGTGYEDWTGRRIFRKSQVVDGYLFKNNSFYGYIGDEQDIEVPEGITGIGGLYYGNPYFKSVKLPSTISYISANTLGLFLMDITLYIHEDTVIAPDASINKHIIIRYR